MAPDVDEFPADTAGAALPGSVAGDTVARTVEAAELLNVDVDQLAGALALVAPDGLSRPQRLLGSRVGVTRSTSGSPTTAPAARTKRVSAEMRATSATMQSTKCRASNDIGR